MGPGSSPGNAARPSHQGAAYYHGMIDNLVVETRVTSPLKIPQPFA